ncbi:hypothetical protein MAPG_03146 [Magnaporthiopsis poae ATCC 64411]|uniref:Uncharacterized protein n=1 Tax=Magnaporthiopsis poae (strain ATCC 64411 / 73-15) TaxID=644358 RepID=A0A0C4DT86_MAGP6|nr:hypothetical protein MAPG_03146 [Magnaporthiopsis poae ATCC 64411]
MLGNAVIPDTALRHGAASSQRPKHQTNRSISELSPTRLHNHSHHHHHAHRQQASISKRDDNNVLPNSAPSRPSVDLAIPRSEGVTPNITPIPSRRPSILAASAPEDAPSRPPLPAPFAVPGKEENSSLDREKSLATAAGGAGGTAGGLAGRRGRTDELLADVGAQIDGLGTFDSQRRRIESLQSRIHDGRERIQQLSGRVDAVHERIEGWERADREWQERTRRRLKTVWVVTLVLVLVVLVFLLVIAGHDVPPSQQQPHVADKGESTASAAPPTSEPPDWVRSAIASGRVPTPPGGAGCGGPGEAREHGEDSPPGVRLFKSLSQNGRDSRVEAEKQLRMFDEL